MSKSSYLSNASLKEKPTETEQLYHMLVVKELLNIHGSSFFPLFLRSRDLPYCERTTYFVQCRKFLEHLEAALEC